MLARENPFRTDRLEGLPFRFTDGSMSELLARLEKLAWRGAIVGPHGSGKTTLLEHVIQEIMQLGFRVRFTRLDDQSRKLSRRFTIPVPDRRDFLFVDGVDLLPGIIRLCLKIWSRHAGGLVITSHRPCFLPVSYECRPSKELLTNLTRLLLEDRDVTGFPDLNRLYDFHHGNLREVFMSLYDHCAAEYMS